MSDPLRSVPMGVHSPVVAGTTQFAYGIRTPENTR